MPHQQTPRQQKSQFNLRELLAVMLGVGLLAGAARWNFGYACLLTPALIGGFFARRVHRSDRSMLAGIFVAYLTCVSLGVFVGIFAVALSLIHVPLAGGALLGLTIASAMGGIAGGRSEQYRLRTIADK